MRLGDSIKEEKASEVSHTSASAARRKCCVLDVFSLFLDLDANDEIFPPLSVFQYVVSFSDKFNA